MKTSNKMLLGTFSGMIVFFIIASLLSCGFVERSRVFSSSVAMGEVNAGNIQIQNSSSTQNDIFNKIDVRGGWQITIKQGEKCDVKVTAPPELQNIIKVENSGGVLYLSLLPHYENIHNIYAEITMPKLDEISIAGAAELKFTNFNNERLAINSSGASDIKGIANVIKNLNLDLSGASHIDLRNSQVTNAQLDIVGASDVKLNMMGGDIMGSVAGFSSITYSGSVKNQNIHTSGMASIGRE